MALAPGTACECRYRDTPQFFPGTVDAVDGGGLYAIAYVALAAAPAEEPALAAEEPAEEPAKAVPDGFVVGARVLAKYRGKGQTFPGSIAAVNADGTVDVAYDDGDGDVGPAGEK